MIKNADIQRFVCCLSLLFVFQSLVVAQGPYAPPAGQQGTRAIHKDSSAVIDWASQCWVQRGWLDIADKSMGFVSAGTETNAIGVANGQTVSLGDSGIAVVKFTTPLYNNVGWDFAIFENAFDDTFLELAFVEVSADSVNWYRFPAHSLTQTNTSVGSFGTIDATEVNNLAGKYRAQYGTPFDIQEIEEAYLIALPFINYVRIIDVIGSIDPDFASYDAHDNVINDPYPTAFSSGGFDLDAVAVVYTGVPSSVKDVDFTFSFHPNPVKDLLTVEGNRTAVFTLKDFSGKIVGYFEKQEYLYRIDVGNLPTGIYFLYSDRVTIPQKIIKY
ncbi:MAG: T9SS type A sorting domain-containing protein [Flavobacteriales bacterium]